MRIEIVAVGTELLLGQIAVLWPALRAVGGMALGLGLAAFYIVPGAFEQQWVQIDRAIAPGIRVEDSFLFAHTANAFHDQVLRTASWILIVELGVAILAAYLAWRKQAGGRARMSGCCAMTFCEQSATCASTPSRGGTSWSCSTRSATVARTWRPIARLR